LSGPASSSPASVLNSASGLKPGGQRASKPEYTSLPLTQRDLADLVGLGHRDTVGNAFKAINDRAGVSVVRTEQGVGAFGVDVHALRTFIDKEWPHT